MSFLADYQANTPHTGSVIESLTETQRTTDGTGSAQADRVFRRSGVLAAAASHSYNTLAAGGLTDAYGQAIDLDELKGIMVKCTSGAIKIDAPAANFAGFFGTASDFVPVANGACWSMMFGATGLDVTVNSKFDIIDTAGGAGSTYEIIFWGAQ
jgi:hypothetical protein